MGELAELLSSKAGIGKAEAIQFLTAVIETIQDGVNHDKLVKIKGLGTFKVIDVDARESVNVNTGERVTIDGHQKLSFIPDAAIKELVNRPFSQFETVVLNEGVEFDDNPGNIETLENPETLENLETLDRLENLDRLDNLENLGNPKPSEAPEAPTAPESPAPQEPTASQETPAPQETPETQEIPETQEKKESYWWLWLLIGITVCVISFACGYLLGRHMDKQSLFDEDIAIEVPVIDTPVVAAPVVVDTLTIDTLKKDTPAVDTLKKDTPAVDTATKPEKKAVEKEAKPEPKEEWKKYEKMDVRVRTGAYGIVGLDHIEKVRPGDTTKRIAKRTLGDGMECYIEVYNNIKTPDLKEGQNIKIPKLKLKKSLRNKNK
jgi:nucleoid DNA-binding protein